MPAGRRYSRKEIQIDTSQVDNLLKELEGFEEEVASATYHALNRTIDQVITQTARVVKQNYAIKDTAQDIKKTFRGGIKRPTKTDLTASLTSRGHTLSFAHFPFSPKKPPKRPKKGFKSAFQKAVVVTIKKSTGAVLSRKGFVAHTGAKDPAKVQYNVFKRLGRKRLPIAPIRTLSIPQMISNEKVSDEIQKFAQDKFHERLEHEITREILNIGRKVKGR